MKQSLLLFLLVLLTAGTSSAQRKKEKTGDEHFASRRYTEAISAYKKEIEQKGISLFQQLSLADSYFQIDNYEEAAKWYWKLHRLDTSATTPLFKPYHLNYAMRSLLASEKYRDSSTTLLEERLPEFPKELGENADFNWNLLSSELEQDLDYEIFSCNVNTEHMEFGPAFYKQQLLFSSDRPDFSKDDEGTYTGYLDVFVSARDSLGQLSKPVLFDQIDSSPFHKATPFFAASLNSVLYIASNTRGGNLDYDPDGKNSLSIVSKRLGSRESNFLMKDLSISFYYPFYDELSGRLYFAADLPGSGYGGTDIYFVYTNQGQIMSAPINLGPRINSPGNEIAPFIFEESLYFSSDIFYGMGGMDMYRANIQDAETFSIPVNLGAGINTGKDDYGLVLENFGEGLLGYFASDRPGGAGMDDLYGFIVAEKPGLKTLTLEGKISKPYGAETISGVLVELYDMNGILLKETYSDDNGRYRLEVPWEVQVRVRAYKNRFSFFNVELGGEQLEDLQDEPFNIQLSLYDDLVVERHKQKVIRLDEFYFGKGKTRITDEIKRELEKVVEFAKMFPKAQFRIECHTDSRGGSASNFKFTQDRADAIKKYLIDRGVPSSQLPYAMGFGEDKLVNNCKNGVFCLEILHKQNQRTEFAIINDYTLFEP